MFYNLKEGILDFGDGKCRYISFGCGSEPLIMIQGLNTRGIKGAGASLALMYRCFARKYRVYLFDRREELPERVTIEALARDLAAAMDKLSLCGAYVLGVSMGGMIAQQLAITRPDLVKKLVIAVSASRCNPTIEGAIHEWIRLTREGKFRALVKDMAERMYSEKYFKMYKPFLPLLTLLQKPKDEGRFIKLCEACLTARAYDDLSRITCKTLVIGGGEDKIVSSEASLEIAERIGCKIKMYEGLGHAAYEEARDFNPTVLEFFSQNS